MQGAGEWSWQKDWIVKIQEQIKCNKYAVTDQLLQEVDLCIFNVAAGR